MKICTQMAVTLSNCRYRSMLHKFASCKNCVTVHLKLMSTNSSREMTKFILSLLLKLFSSQQFALLADEKLCSLISLKWLIRNSVTRLEEFEVVSCELSVDFCQLSVGFCQLLFCKRQIFCLLGT